MQLEKSKLFVNLYVGHFWNLKCIFRVFNINDLVSFKMVPKMYLKLFQKQNI